MPKVEYLKLFTGDAGVMVALFTSDHGWIENIAAETIFKTDIPVGLPHEQMFMISEFPLAQFKDEFLTEYTDLSPAAPTPPAPPIFIGSIIANVARDLNQSPDQARSLTEEIFRRMRIHLSAGRSLDSSFASVSASDQTPDGWVISFK